MGFSRRLVALVEAPIFGQAIMGVILFNAMLLGMETSDGLMARIGPAVRFLDTLCLAIFVAELALKMAAYRLRFFVNPWNLFDFVIVGIALFPAAQAFSALRALRILRVLRVVSVTPRLRRVVEGFVTAIPGMGSVFLLLGIIFYIGSVISTTLYGDTFPDWFGNLGRSAYSLFQIMTLESWSMGIVRPVMEVHPHAWAFFVPFIMATTFVMVNLLVGLIVNSMQEAHHEGEAERTDAYRDEVLARLEAIERRLDRVAQPDRRTGTEK
ncbi:ion transporter [Jhaorihella thermophila]|nr:ion transporter [Jhaorihella thermophila]